MAQETRYRVGLIGGGRAGPARARAFDAHPLCEMVAVADTDPENLELTARRFGAAAYDTYGDMLAKERLDIVLPILPVRPNADAVVAWFIVPVIDCLRLMAGRALQRRSPMTPDTDHLHHRLQKIMPKFRLSDMRQVWPGLVPKKTW